MKSIESRAWLLALVGLVLLLCFAFACRDKAAMAELEKFRAQAKAEEENKDLAKRVIDALNEGDVGAIKELAAPESLLSIDHRRYTFLGRICRIRQGDSSRSLGSSYRY
jgi:hypothetical protein